ncbi:MAG: hypothetical protein LWX83_18490, partial [Anaerolineae bacterium]|nr:hypothetical protein [Anaerolineae bacterium]
MHSNKSICTIYLIFLIIIVEALKIPVAYIGVNKNSLFTDSDGQCGGCMKAKKQGLPQINKKTENGGPEGLGTENRT